MIKDLRQRVKEMKFLSPKEISFNERNWREHPDEQTSALTGILEEIGIAGALLCYYSERNDGKLTLIDGHLRKKIAPNEKWPVLITDLNDDEADTLLVAYDPVASMVRDNKEKLDSLLQDMKVKSQSLAEYLSRFAASKGLYFDNMKGMTEIPKFIEYGEEDKFNFIIRCDTIDELNEIKESLGISGTKINYKEIRIEKNAAH